MRVEFYLAEPLEDEQSVRVFVAAIATMKGFRENACWVCFLVKSNSKFRGSPLGPLRSETFGDDFLIE